MVKHVGVDVAVSKDSGVVCAGGRALGKAAVSVSIRRSLLARWHAHFSEEAAGMAIVESNPLMIKFGSRRSETRAGARK